MTSMRTGPSSSPVTRASSVGRGHVPTQPNIVTPFDQSFPKLLMTEEWEQRSDIVQGSFEARIQERNTITYEKQASVHAGIWNGLRAISEPEETLNKTFRGGCVWFWAGS